MRRRRVTRRGFVLGTATGLALAPLGRAGAAEAIELDWLDLIPREPGASETKDLEVILGIIEHGQLATGFEQALSGAVTTEYDGKRVRIPGFMVPLSFEGSTVREFLLVPYIGACIHVPPPPPNQIVMVTAEEPYEITGYFDAVYVEGTMATEGVSTELASVGYSITDAEVSPYE